MNSAMALLVSLSVAQVQQPQQPQQPQTPSPSSQQSSQTTVVVPPPPGQQPVVVQPQDRPLTVAPCPPATVVRREHRDPVVTVLLATLSGGAVGALFGTGVGLANGDDTSHAWKRDIGTGTLVGLGVGAAAGTVLAIVDYTRDVKVAVAPVVGARSAGLAVAGRW